MGVTEDPSADPGEGVQLCQLQPRKYLSTEDSNPRSWKN